MEKRGLMGASYLKADLSRTEPLVQSVFDFEIKFLEIRVSWTLEQRSR